jgi:hypothetical protein
MADMTIAEVGCGTVSLPLSPFVSNRYHFGMLLGVADLEADQGYHRGKAWLHSAWLHGEGAIWGLAVEARPEAGEVVVDPGLALDRNGRELWVPDRLCLDLGRWFAERRPEDLEVTDDGAGGVLFRVHVRLCAEQCLDRPVPSISEPCDGSESDTSYSRTVERAGADLAPGPVPEPPMAPYLRLRQLVGQVPAEDEAVVAALEEVAAADPPDRPATQLRAFRRLAALDSLDLAPEGGPGALLPADDDACIALADLDVHLRPDGDRWVMVADGDHPTTVDNTVRPAHVRTRTLQELAGFPVAAAPAPDALVAPEEVEVDAPPRAVAGSARLAGRSLALAFTAPLQPATVAPEAFAVTVLRAAGWREVAVEAAELDEAGTTVTLRLASAPRARPVRALARGAGRAPLLGTDGRALSGADIDGRTVSSGEDAALMVTETE